jgi:RHS repeat-associated protein
VTGAWRTEFAYYGLNRRRERKEFTWTGSAWSLTNETRYVYDGLLILQERDGDNIPTITYTRGLDLSGSLQGAGGIGGLLALSDQRASASTPTNYFYHADGNGNIVALINQRNEIVSRYLYDPFGNLLAKSGPMADFNRIGFSSKERHHSGLVLYEFRAYDPNLQRWLNQDPIGEAGGLNLHGFVRNDPVNAFDPFGLADPHAGMVPIQYPGGRIIWMPRNGGQIDFNLNNPSSTGRDLAEASAKAYAGFAAGEAGGAALGVAVQSVRCTKLYRAVSEKELADILKNGFRPGKGTLEAKEFATSAEDAVRFGKDLHKLDKEPFFVVEATVRNSAVNQATHMTLDSKSAVVVPSEQLSSFNSSVNSVQTLPALPLPK